MSEIKTVRFYVISHCHGNMLQYADSKKTTTHMDTLIKNLKTEKTVTSAVVGLYWQITLSCAVDRVARSGLDSTFNLKEETGTGALTAPTGQRSQIDPLWSAFCKHIQNIAEPLSKHPHEQEAFRPEKQEVLHATRGRFQELQPEHGLDNDHKCPNV